MRDIFINKMEVQSQIVGMGTTLTHTHQEAFLNRKKTAALLQGRSLVLIGIGTLIVFLNCFQMFKSAIDSLFGFYECCMQFFELSTNRFFLDQQLIFHFIDVRSRKFLKMPIPNCNIIFCWLIF